MVHDYTIADAVRGLSVAQVNEIPDGVANIHAKAIWDEGNEGEGVVVAVFDTGVNKDHPDLQGRIIGGYNFTTDFNSDPDNYADEHFHGTHVCGTIAANRDGVGVVGVAPKAQILMLKVLSASEGGGAWEWLINAIDYAISWRGPSGERVRIFSMSLCGPFAPITLHDAIIRADAAGIVIVCAAGNNGDSDGTTTEISFPAYYPEAICVGGYNGWGGISSFSNSNDQVDLIAPANDVLSTSNDGLSYSYSSGTSMATPHVSGALALLLNKLDKILTREVTAVELYNMLINDCSQTLSDYPKTQQGNGLLMLGSDVVTISIDEIDFNDVLNWFTGNFPRPVLNSYAYWEANAVPGGMAIGEYVQGFMKKTYIVHGLNMTVAE